MAAPIVYLRAGDIYLRPLEPVDADFMYEMCNNDAEMRRLTGTQRPFSRDQIVRYIENQWKDDTRATFGIVRQEDDQLVGEVVLNEIDHRNRSAGFRIAIADAYTARGYGSAATRLMLDYGFGMLNLHRIELQVYTLNERAAHVYEKCGFKREGVKRQDWYFDHQYFDSIIMSILEDEYRDSRA